MNDAGEISKECISRIGNSLAQSVGRLLSIEQFVDSQQE
jgi:hypothetical protein